MTSSCRKNTALITGAAQGIGEAIAMRLFKEGISCFFLIDKNWSELSTVKNNLENMGAQVETLVVDMENVEVLRAKTLSLLETFGKLDLVINAAGTTARGSITSTTIEVFDHIFSVNVKAPFFLIQSTLGSLNEGAVVINITSMLSYGGPPFLLPYSASKAALVALTKGIANTLKRDKVHVFGINLGWTVTPGEQEVQTTVHGLGDNWHLEIGSQQPFGRLLVPSDVAGLVAFLSSKDASMMTGAIIDLDQFVSGTVDDNPGMSGNV